MKDDCIKGSKVLRKLIPGALLGRTGDSPQVWTAGYGQGWNIVENDQGVFFAIYRGYFDISGWNSEQLTGFITGVSYQESDSWRMPNATIGTYPTLQTWDIVSKCKLPDEVVDGRHFLVPSDAAIYSPPGMMRSNYNLEEIFDGRYRAFANDVSTASETRQITRTSWGTGDATAGYKIHITRIIRLTSVQAVNGGVYVPPMAIVVPAVIVEEKDLVYMERLRRTFVSGESR